ncbi:Response regulator receiver protein [Desulfamplus magnetovallimortis]|uniref:Response regulator receiver protein n=1 Tax=Desulfamplus magnetovallimortis TaxID=1246637 RepID=A0A1W1HIB8_9BACT|nr:response regulator [Desulfamplus magnetovallimortis]SLM32118.1 Response regulator receiver protein [Desulfamplus magnetovallimortis]
MKNIMIDKQQTILIIDDTPSNLTMIGCILENSYDVRVAISGIEGLKQIFKEPPALVLLDIMMPEMDGYEVISQIKNTPEISHVPVIFLTALTEQDVEKKGLAMGAVDFIRKPILPELVLARVKIHLDLQNQKKMLEIQAEELKTINEKLKKSLEEVKTLRGILPLCSFCKKIRNPNGEWIGVDEYIYLNSEADISHGLCPECLKLHYPEYN